MNTKWIVIAVIIIAIVLVGVIFAALYFTTYNNLVALDETVNSSWAQVETVLQRRFDLIPSVVEAARAYIEYEGSILENITRLRSQWAEAYASGDENARVNASSNLNAEILQFRIIVENYPDLYASEIVSDLIAELAGTENRISVERMRFNEAVRDYNQARRSFPANLWASGWGFEAREFFEATSGAENAPDVTLN